MRILLGVTCIAVSLPACGGSPAGSVSGYTAAGVYYEVSGSGPPVVLIHGFSLDRRMWEPQLEVLRDGFRTIRYDLRGHGNSAAPGAPYAAYDDLRAVLDTLHVERAALVGLSAGAQVAIDFAIAHPDRVNRLFLASPGLSGYVSKEPFTWFEPVADALRAGDLARAAELWADTPLMTISGNPAGAELMRTIVSDNAQLWSLPSNPDEGLRPPAIGRLAGIRVPTVVLLGELDLGNIHGVADTLTTCVAHARLVTLPGTHHIVNLEVPDAFNEAMLTFLEEESLPSQSFEPSPCGS